MNNIDNKLLNEPQAEAVYSAMVALNNVGGKISARLEDSAISARHITVTEDVTGVFVSLFIRGAHHLSERYTDQNAFAKAYNLE